MQAEKHDFSQPFSIHLEPDEDLNSSVTLEFSVQQIPCGGDPKVSCYESNGCIVFEGYCPIDSQNPLSECEISTTKTDSKQKQDIPWSKESEEKVPPFGPFMHWDVIPKLLHDIINGAGLKMSEQEKPYSKRDRSTLIYPRITGQESTGYSSDDIDFAHDPFVKRQWKTVGNIVDTKKPRGGRPGERVSAVLSAVLSAYANSTPFKRQPRQYHNKRDANSMTVTISSSDSGDVEVDVSEEDVNVAHGISEVIKSVADAAVGTGRIDEEASECVLCGSHLHRRQHHHQRTHHAKDVSTAGQSSRAMDDAATHTSTGEHTQKPKHRRTRKETTVYRVTDNKGQQSRATRDVFTQASTAGHSKHSKGKTVRQEDITYPAATSHGHRSRASHEGHKKHSKEKTRKHEVTAYPVTTNQGQLPRGMAYLFNHASAAEHKEHAKGKHPRHEITAYPVQTYTGGAAASPAPASRACKAGCHRPSSSQPHSKGGAEGCDHCRPPRDAGPSTLDESEMSENDQSETTNTFDNEQNIAAYPMSRGSGSFFKRKSKTDDEFKRCTMQHVLFPKKNCPYSPSLTSLPLDESDIEYIIRRAQLAKSSLPAENTLCPMERWQLRGYQRPSSKSGRSRSSG